ncbi:MAG: UvrD-helicase domain-containing protein, partial [Gammaproteobacteria bacterium]
MTDKLADRAARRAALDPARSFIVQAPAGSGKTELLTQRFLALLAIVEAPEEIFAMTFTRKAAGEMRQRIIQALARAGDDTEPEQAHQALTWKLARAARQRDEEMGWRLAQSPGRLRVMTIDALHALISRQMPIMSGAGGALTISQRPSRLYELAATRTL